MLAVQFLLLKLQLNVSVKRRVRLMINAPELLPNALNMMRQIQLKLNIKKSQLYTVWRIQLKIQLPKSLVPKLMPKVLGELATRA
jgi:DNA polymerase III psi subunit